MFALLLLGTLAIGSATAANNQARYAATDLAQRDHRARALSLVVWATTLGSVVGPNLAGPGAGGGALAGVIVAQWGYVVLNIVAGGLALVVRGAAMVARDRAN